jgi:hypothetical protein
MYQQWKHLLFLHWQVSADLLRPLIPPELEIDTYDGQAYIGLVPFSMKGVRPKYLPSLPWLSNFLETNVRTYVHFRGKDPGVWFFSLDAANPVAVAIARMTFGLPYFHAQMKLEVGSIEGAESTLHYRSARYRLGPEVARTDIRARVVGVVEPANPGSLEYFLAERYLLYSRHHGKLFQGQVHHTPYPLQTAEVDFLDETLVASAGVTRPAVAPLAHFARGVSVEVFGLTPVEL